MPYVTLEGSILIARWPLCVPLLLNRSEGMAKELEVPRRVLDINIQHQFREVDKLVRGSGGHGSAHVVSIELSRFRTLLRL